MKQNWNPADRQISSTSSAAALDHAFDRRRGQQRLGVIERAKLAPSISATAAAPASRCRSQARANGG